MGLKAVVDTLDDIDEPFRTLRVVMTDIPFDDILRIEDGGTT